MTNKPLLSIVTVVYNGESTIERTIQSIQNQTYDNIEYIIVDGKSNDRTLEIVKKYSCVTKLISEPDNGIYDAMNKGIRMASGDYVALLNANDWYELETCEIIAKAIQESNRDIYYGMLRVVDEEQKLQFVCGYTTATLNYFMIAHPTCFVKKNIYEKFLYDTKYKSAADYDLMLKLKSIASFEFIEKILANFTLGGMSDSNFGKIETLKIKRKHGCIRFTDYVARMFFYRFCRLILRKR